MVVAAQRESMIGLESCKNTSKFA